MMSILFYCVTLIGGQEACLNEVMYKKFVELNPEKEFVVRLEMRYTRTL